MGPGFPRQPQSCFFCPAKVGSGEADESSGCLLHLACAGAFLLVLERLIRFPFADFSTKNHPALPTRRMSTLDGLVAARLFLEHANTLRCNNGELLSRLRRATKRDPHTTPADSDQDKKHLLPTEEKLRHAFPDTREVQELLCCTCYLCGDTSNLMPMLHDRGVLQHYEKLKGLAVLILSGCLFALKELCERVDDGVPFKFAIGVPRAYFSRLGVAPDRCSHRRQDEYGSLRSIADLCLNCRAKAFRGAVVEKQKVVDIFRVQRTRIIYERSSVNMPYIDEHPLAMAYERLTPKFVTSMLEPSYIHPNDLDLKVSS